MKTINSLLLASISLLTLVGCSNNTKQSIDLSSDETTSKTPAKPTDDLPEGTKRLGFKDALSYEYLSSINGEKVAINGYMATSSPVDGSFIFLMNLPFQSCPFCKPNTSILSNTMEVYPKSGTKFTYTTSAIRIYGTLMVAPTVNDFFTDRYGYEFNFKIVDATYSIVDESSLSPEMNAWQQIASSNLVMEIYDMLDYVNFVAMWPTYFINSYEDIDGNLVPGFYLYPADALRFLDNDGAQYNYGRKSGYFDGLRRKANKIENEAMAELVSIINDSETLADTCYSALKNGDYTYEYKYVEKFGIEDYIFTLNDQASFESQIDALILRFERWFSNWEL